MKSKHYERNYKTVEALRNAGANLDKPHSIEHHLYCYSESEFEKLKKLGIEYGYLILHDGIGEYEGEVFWQLDLVKSITPKLENIEAQAIEIEAIAERVNADYDGWGTEVKK